MANVKTGVSVAPKNNGVTVSSINVMAKDPKIQERFNKMLGKKAAGFLSSLMTVVNNNDLLKKADPNSILTAAATAAALDLPVNPSLGMAYVVPYGGKGQFQMGYRGYITLAQRSGQMKSIVMTKVYEGELDNWNRFTETYTPGERKSDKVVGYYARFELVNGFAKATYWTKEEVTDHALKFNPMCKAAKKLCGTWVTNFDAMACKTVLKSILATYAPLSIEMQLALTSDNAVINESSEGDMVPVKETVDVAYEAVPAEADNEEVPFNDEPGAPTKEEQEEILAMMEK